MTANQRVSSRLKGSIRPVAISAIVTILYAGTIFIYSVASSSNVSISEPIWQTLAFLLVAGTATIGVPIFLWRRYTLRSPGTLLICILIFWHVLVYVPPIGTGQGDSPGFFFVFILAPIYLVAYVMLAAAEYWLRYRDSYWSLSAQ